MDQGTVDEIAALFWEQAESRFRRYPDQHEAMADPETMALDFLTQNPGLWRGHKDWRPCERIQEPIFFDEGEVRWTAEGE
jgi:hypothetical protein